MLDSRMRPTCGAIPPPAPARFGHSFRYLGVFAGHRQALPSQSTPARACARELIGREPRQPARPGNSEICAATVRGEARHWTPQATRISHIAQAQRLSCRRTIRLISFSMQSKGKAKTESLLLRLTPAEASTLRVLACSENISRQELLRSAIQQLALTGELKP